ncbi:DUF262 domain-containing protein [Pararhizobium sp. BT-229]|uniref:GmrSD restriction endonuclease domain-containing protein n=1 Tax=Pararhizobium sp. BT-229 TaxID=2986923 RepID=UPI0021F7EDB8|nr:DUF262 domain-containing protein [Pararhizobium sp. BT-229]MCV9964559.1 DUF262 domain-containing protein [Pararhizobium sp. BT-229]
MRVEQQSTFLLDMVRNAADGNLGLAPFQRQYVWTKEDVEKLMKSMLNKWPIGSFTTWTPEREERGLYPTKGRLGPVEHPKDVQTLVLDGQNRLASLIYASLVQSAPTEPAHPYSEREIDVWFGEEILVADFETKSITFMLPEESWSATRVPFGEIMDGTIFNRKRQMGIFRRALDLGMTDEAFNWLLDKIPNRVREARVTVTNLRDATLEEARECYMTICKAGQPISDEEFDMAFSYSIPAAATSKGPRP